MFYIGYVCVNLILLGIFILDKLYDCLFLVVFISNYNFYVLVFIGINIIQNFIDIMREEFGFRFLQDVVLYIFWYLVFWCILIREKEFYRNGYVLGLVKSVEVIRIIIFFNSNVIIEGYVDKKILYSKVIVMMYQFFKICILDDVDIEVILYFYVYEDYQIFFVIINNVIIRIIFIL